MAIRINIIKREKIFKRLIVNRIHMEKYSLSQKCNEARCFKNEVRLFQSCQTYTLHKDRFHFSEVFKN